MKNRVYNKLKYILSSYGFTMENDGTITNSDQSSLYVDIKIREHHTGSFGISENNSIMQLEVVVELKEIKNQLDADILFSLSEQINRCGKLLKKIEKTPLSYVLWVDGRSSDLICDICEYWKEKDGIGYGKCTCEHSTSNGCRVISFHTCDLK